MLIGWSGKALKIITNNLTENPSCAPVGAQAQAESLLYTLYNNESDDI